MKRAASNDWRLARAKHPLLVWFGSWFGCGLSPVAPGTVGSIGAMPLYFLLRFAGPWAVAAGAVSITILGVWISGKIARAAGIKDPQFVVIDEVAGVLVTLSFAKEGWSWALVGLVLFRLFDITKPPPCRLIERKLPPGPGIMLDDTIAGIMAAIVLVIAQYFIAI